MSARGGTAETGIKNKTGKLGWLSIKTVNGRAVVSILTQYNLCPYAVKSAAYILQKKCLLTYSNTTSNMKVN